jgi:hypothetical protein
VTSDRNSDCNSDQNSDCKSSDVSDRIKRPYRDQTAAANSDCDSDRDKRLVNKRSYR